MSINPLVSCIIPSYKRNDTITRALDSVLAQSYSNIEIIIVDDNTPNDDYSLKLQSIVNSYNNLKIIYLQQENHINGAAARNFGIMHSHGDIITFLDDDDEWCSSKARINGTLAHTTAMFGFTLAGLVMQDLCKK